MSGGMGWGGEDGVGRRDGMGWGGLIASEAPSVCVRRVFLLPSHGPV